MEKPHITRNLSLHEYRRPESSQLIRRNHTFQGSENPTVAASLARMFLKGCNTASQKKLITSKEIVVEEEGSKTEETSVHTNDVVSEYVPEVASNNEEISSGSVARPSEQVKKRKVRGKANNKKKNVSKQKRPPSAPLGSQTAPSREKRATQPTRQKYSRADLSWARMKTMQFIRSGAGTTEEAQRREVYDYDPESSSFSQTVERDSTFILSVYGPRRQRQFQRVLMGDQRNADRRITHPTNSSTSVVDNRALEDEEGNEHSGLLQTQSAINATTETIPGGKEGSGRTGSTPHRPTKPRRIPLRPRVQDSKFTLEVNHTPGQPLSAPAAPVSTAAAPEGQEEGDEGPPEQGSQGRSRETAWVRRFARERGTYASTELYWTAKLDEFEAYAVQRQQEQEKKEAWAGLIRTQREKGKPTVDGGGEDPGEAVHAELRAAVGYGCLMSLATRRRVGPCAGLLSRAAHLLASAAFANSSDIIGLQRPDQLHATGVSYAQKLRAAQAEARTAVTQQVEALNSLRDAEAALNSATIQQQQQLQRHQEQLAALTRRNEQLRAELKHATSSLSARPEEPGLDSEPEAGVQQGGSKSDGGGPELDGKGEGGDQAPRDNQPDAPPAEGPETGDAKSLQRALIEEQIQAQVHTQVQALVQEQSRLSTKRDTERRQKLQAQAQAQAQALLCTRRDLERRTSVIEMEMAMLAEDQEKLSKARLKLDQDVESEKEAESVRAARRSSESELDRVMARWGIPEVMKERRALRRQVLRVLRGSGRKDRGRGDEIREDRSSDNEEGGAMALTMAKEEDNYVVRAAAELHADQAFWNKVRELVGSGDDNITDNAVSNVTKGGEEEEECSTTRSGAASTTVEEGVKARSKQ